VSDHLHRKAAAHGGTITTSPWVRAPLLLLRQPVVFLAIVAATGILAIAAASGPLFLSTIGTASLHAQAQQRCPESAQPTVNALLPGDALPAAAKDGVSSFARSGLPPAYYSANGYAHVGSSLVHLFSRKGALDHVTKLTPDTGAAGVWLPNVFAAKLNAKPGDTIKTVGGVPLPVAGIYRDLAPDPFALSHLSRYWCTFTNQIVSTVASDGAIAATAPRARQGPFIIADQPIVERASESDVQLTISSPMSTITNPLSTFDEAVSQTRTAADSMTDLLPMPDRGLADLTQTAHHARKGVTGSIVPIEVAGVVVAALLVGGAGLFWAAARKREIRLLVARGVGPVPLAGKAMLETVVPAIIGATVGFLSTSAMVRAVGPARALEADAPWQAGRLVVVTLVLGMLVIGIIGALAGRDRTTGRKVSWVRVVPWEVALLALAIVLALKHKHDSAVSVDHTVVRISALVVLYPLLGATAALLLIGRVIGSLLPKVGESASRRRVTPYLTLRRISRSRAVVIGLIIGTALPCCLLMYGSTVTDTVSHEVTQKYQTNLGAPHVLQVYGVHGALYDPKTTGSQVVIYRQDVLLGDDTPAYVLGVDTATFSKFAFVSSAQRTDVNQLSPHLVGDGLPAIIVNPDGQSPTDRLHIGDTTMQLHHVATMSIFPGLRNSAYPMVVVDQRALGKIDPNVERLNQMWTNAAQYSAARKLIAADNFSVLFELTSDVVVGTTGLLPVTWLFGYLRALAILIGVVAIAGLVFGLAARTRRRRVSYVLSRRMGMSKTAHLNSLLMELTLVIGLGWVAGSGLGVGSFGFVYPAFDVYPQLAPPAEFTVPSVPIAVTAVLSAAIIVLASIATHLLAERTRPAEILRLE
jgi:putative ABC transport system permease protein